MKLRRVRRKSRRLRAGGFFCEEEEFYDEPIIPFMVGSYINDEGPESRRWPWSKPEQQKPAFGFARALEDK